jgi:hypothetical protein
MPLKRGRRSYLYRLASPVLPRIQALALRVIAERLEHGYAAAALLNVTVQATLALGRPAGPASRSIRGTAARRALWQIGCPINPLGRALFETTSREHARTDLLIVVECEDDVWPSGAGECPM